MLAVPLSTPLCHGLGLKFAGIPVQEGSNAEWTKILLSANMPEDVGAVLTNCIVGVVAPETLDDFRCFCSELTQRRNTSQRLSPKYALRVLYWISRASRQRGPKSCGKASPMGTAPARKSCRTGSTLSRWTPCLISVSSARCTTASGAVTGISAGAISRGVIILYPSARRS